MCPALILCFASPMHLSWSATVFGSNLRSLPHFVRRRQQTSYSLNHFLNKQKINLTNKWNNLQYDLVSHWKDTFMKTTASKALWPKNYLLYENISDLQSPTHTAQLAKHQPMLSVNHILLADRLSAVTTATIGPRYFAFLVFIWPLGISQPTWGGGRGGLVLLWLHRLPKQAVDLDHVHPLAHLVLQLCQALLRGDLLSGQALHVVLIFLLLTLQCLKERRTW